MKANEPQRLAGKVALISGAARGMGAAFARAFIAEGALVMMGDVLDQDGEALASELGDAARYCRLDVSDESHWQAAVARTEDAFGPISILINNAGIFAMGSIPEMDFADYKRVIDVNQHGTFLGMKAAHPSLIRAGGGSIVNMSSVNGFAGSPLMVAYTASKFAVRGMTKAAAVEFGNDGIRVNSVHPGTIETPMTEGAPAPVRQPIKRKGQVEDVAELVVYLASDRSSFVTGSEFPIDGGYLCLVGEVVV